MKLSLHDSKDSFGMSNYSSLNRCPGECSPESRFSAKKTGMWILAFAMLFISFTVIAQAQITYTITKTNNAPNPVPSGQPFTFTITYSWSGGAPGTLYIVDNLPATLDVLSTLPSVVPVGNQVTFILSGLSLPSGSGTVQINARFKPGVTCGGTVACNRATITDKPSAGNPVTSNQNCVTAATPTNKWQLTKDWLAGCAVDDQVILRIYLYNPPGSDIGGLNLTNISLSDYLPAGAIIQSVASSWTGWSGNTLTGGPTSLGVTPWGQWYVAYITVKFPSPTFVAGQTVIDTAVFKFNTPCNPTMITWTDTAKVTLCQGVTQGSLGKYLSLSMYFPNNPGWYPVFSPGCCGTYTLYYTNTGTLGQTSFVMEDILPSKVDLNKIITYVPAGNTPVTVNLYCWSGSTCSTSPCSTVVYNTAGYQTMTGLPANICRVKWSYSGTIAVTQYLYNYLDVCVSATDHQTGAPVLAGQNIINTVTAQAASLPTITATHTKVVDAIQPKVIATKLFIGSCDNTCQVQPNGPFQPGDTVRFRMAVANIGNASATTCSINDLLPTGLSYIGNETYFYGTFNWMAYIYSPPCCSLAVAIPPQIGGTITTPTVGQTNLTWTFPVLPGRCDGLVDYFLIDFDVKISSNPPALAGQYVNTFTMKASNITPVPSNPAYLTVNAIAQLQAIKQVRKQSASGSPCAPSVAVLPGGIAEFDIKVKNTGNTALSNVCLLDIMPWVGDIKVLPPYTSRGSAFNLPYDPIDGAFSITPTGFNPYFRSLTLPQSQNPKRSAVCGGFCGVTDPPGALSDLFTVTVPNQTYSYKVTANSGVNLAPGASLDVIVPAKVPSGIAPQSSACNSFAIQAIPIGMVNVCLSAESNNACVTVDQLKPCFNITEVKINCVGLNNSGNWIYQLVFTINNISGQTGILSIIPTSGTILALNPTTIPANVPTTVNAIYLSGPGGVGCFKIILSDQKETKLCDSTFCLELYPCPNPCPCPFRFIMDNQNPTPASGNLVLVNNYLTVVGSNVMKIKATIVSASVTQTCGHTTSTYTPAATINSTTFAPVLASGLGTPEVTWTNMLCPPITGQQISLYLNIPSAPGYGCYQTINFCIRYTITDCKCNTCDTLICYTLKRKWIPIIWNGGVGDIKFPGKPYHNDDKSDGILSLPTAFIQNQMLSDTTGTLTITNPPDDDYTQGIVLYSVSLSTSPGVRAVSLAPHSSDWSSGVSSDLGISSSGTLNPGSALIFDVGYENTESFKTWTDTLRFSYSILGSTDTLNGYNIITVRTPGSTGGDILTGDNSGNKVTNARTFALYFQNANFTKDSIAKLILSVQTGSILAVGPNINNQQVSLSGYLINGGSLTFLVSPPDENSSLLKAIPAGTNIGPIYITVASDSPTSIVLNYQTQTSSSDVITNGSLELTNPLTAVSGQEPNPNATSIWLSDAIPNPTDGSALIRFELQKDEQNVSLFVSDVRGTRVATLIDGKGMVAGSHDITFDPGMLPNGVYYYTIIIGSTTQTRKLVILR